VTLTTDATTTTLADLARLLADTHGRFLAMQAERDEARGDARYQEERRDEAEEKLREAKTTLVQRDSLNATLRNEVSLAEARATQWRGEFDAQTRRTMLERERREKLELYVRALEEKLTNLEAALVAATRTNARLRAQVRRLK
jgi:chromosome segregation ATPase